MTITIDNAPPPEPTWQARIEGLEPGQSMLAPLDKLNVMRSKATIVRAAYPERQYRTSKTAEGARIWRLA